MSDPAGERNAGKDDARSALRRRDRGKEEPWVRDFIKRAPLGFLATVGDGGQPFLNSNFKVSRPGSKELITQMYFYGDPLIEQDRQIAKVPEEHRHLLISNAVSDEVSGLPMFQFDIVLAPVNT